jgi:hypothetical protein
MMSKYRKKPVVIEAMQFIITEEIVCRYGVAKNTNSMEICKFMNLSMMNTHTDEEGPYIVIETLEGAMRADIGDYIIKGVKGEFYPCKPDIFLMTYDKE